MVSVLILTKDSALEKSVKIELKKLRAQVSTALRELML